MVHFKIFIKKYNSCTKLAKFYEFLGSLGLFSNNDLETPVQHDDPALTSWSVGFEWEIANTYNRTAYMHDFKLLQNCLKLTI